MLNMDFTQKVVLSTKDMQWVSSPAVNVWRKMLAREDIEQGHATSIVKYDAGASFPLHDHPFGEEILVLDGTFSDDTGDYKAGTYLRNPEGFRHAPFSKDGCTILVKLHQFQKGDNEHVVIDTHNTAWSQGQGNLHVLPLHSYKGEHTALVKWPAGEKFTTHQHFGGEEIYVISGVFKDECASYPTGTWIRSPHGSQHCPYVDEQTIIWVKVGHLPVS